VKFPDSSRCCKLQTFIERLPVNATVHRVLNGKDPVVKSKSEDLPHAQIISLLSGKKQEWVGYSLLLPILFIPLLVFN
jgi:hypothetical protein